MGFFTRLRDRLGKAREAFTPLFAFGASKRPLDETFWHEFEEILLRADFGVATTEKILANLRIVATQELWTTTDQLMARFRRDVAAFLLVPEEARVPRSAPEVVLVAWSLATCVAVRLMPWAA